MRFAAFPSMMRGVFYRARRIAPRAGCEPATHWLATGCRSAAMQIPKNQPPWRVSRRGPREGADTHPTLSEAPTKRSRRRDRDRWDGAAGRHRRGGRSPTMVHAVVCRKRWRPAMEHIGIDVHCSEASSRRFGRARRRTPAWPRPFSCPAPRVSSSSTSSPKGAAGRSSRARSPSCSMPAT